MSDFHLPSFYLGCLAVVLLAVATEGLVLWLHRHRLPKRGP